MPKLVFTNFGRGIEAAQGFIAQAQQTGAGDIRNMTVNDLGRLVRAKGYTEKNATPFGEDVLRVMPCHYLGSEASVSTAHRTHLIVQTQTKLKYWDGAAFQDLTLPPNGLTADSPFDWVVAGGRLFLANGEEAFWVDITPAVPIVHWWGITPNADSGYTPTENHSIVADAVAGGSHDANDHFAYVHTFYNADWGIEGAPTTRDLAFTTGANLRVQLGVQISDDPQVTHTNIYRTEPQDTEAEALAAPLLALIRVPNKNPVTGTVDNTDANELVDNTKNFATEGVVGGQVVTNTTSGLPGRVEGLRTTTNPNDTLYITWGSGGGTWTAGDGYSVSFAVYWDDNRYVGSHTGAGGAANPQDATVDFAKLGMNVVGATVDNIDDGSSATSSGLRETTNSNDTIELGAGLSGGGSNDWQLEERYRIHFGLGSELEGDRDNPPSDLKILTHFAGRIWGARKDSATVVFSKIDGNGAPNFDNFPGDSAIVPHRFFSSKDDGDFVVGLEALPGGGLAIFEENSVTIARGTGLITGLYQVEGIAQTDLDISNVNRSAGCIAPNSIAVIGGTLAFLAPDRQIWAASGGELQPISLPIQPFLDAIPDAMLEKAAGWAYQNCYHLAFAGSGDTENTLIGVFDLSRRYWTIRDGFTDGLDDAHWSTGGTDNGILYAGHGGKAIELFSGADYAGSAFTAAWQSNWVQLPPYSHVTGIYVYGASPAATDVRLDVDDVNGTPVTFTPSAANRFRQGVFGRGRTFRVRLSGIALDALERVEIEYETRR